MHLRCSHSRLTQIAAAVIACMTLIACGPDAPPAAPSDAVATSQTPAQSTSAMPAAAATAGVAQAVPTWRPLNEVPAGIASSHCHIDDLAGQGAAPVVRIQQRQPLAV